MYNLTFTDLSAVDQNWNLNGYPDHDLTPNGSFTGTYNNVHQDNQLQIAITTNNRFAAVTLIYTAATQLWSIDTHTPNEFYLNVQGMNVGLGCLLGSDAETGDTGFSFAA